MKANEIIIRIAQTPPPQDVCDKITALLEGRQPQIINRYIGVTEYVSRSPLSRATVIRMIKDGRLPSRKRGKKHEIPETALALDMAF